MFDGCIPSTSLRGWTRRWISRSGHAAICVQAMDNTEEFFRADTGGIISGLKVHADFFCWKSRPDALANPRLSTPRRRLRLLRESRRQSRAHREFCVLLPSFSASDRFGRPMSVGGRAISSWCDIKCWTQHFPRRPCMGYTYAAVR